MTCIRGSARSSEDLNMLRKDIRAPFLPSPTTNRTHRPARRAHAPDGLCGAAPNRGTGPGACGRIPDVVVRAGVQTPWACGGAGRPWDAGAPAGSADMRGVASAGRASLDMWPLSDIQHYDLLHPASCAEYSFTTHQRRVRTFSNGRSVRHPAPPRDCFIIRRRRHGTLPRPGGLLPHGAP